MPLKKKVPIKQQTVTTPPVSSVGSPLKPPMESVSTSTEKSTVPPVQASPSTVRQGIVPPRRKPIAPGAAVPSGTVPTHSKESPSAETAPRTDYNWHLKLTPGSPEAVAELINRRRRQIMVHSALYYRFNENIVSDQMFDGYCRDLVDLQRQYPDIAATVPYAMEFADFDGSTGFHVSAIPWAVNKAQSLLRGARKSA